MTAIIGVVVQSRIPTTAFGGLNKKSSGIICKNMQHFCASKDF